MTAEVCKACQGKGSRLRGWAICPSECEDCSGTGKKPTPVEIIRRAANKMREDNRHDVDDLNARTLTAVATWLDDAAETIAWSERPGAGKVNQNWSALVVARTYLGADS